MLTVPWQSSLPLSTGQQGALFVMAADVTPAQLPAVLLLNQSHEYITSHASYDSLTAKQVIYCVSETSPRISGPRDNSQSFKTKIFLFDFFVEQNVGHSRKLLSDIHINHRMLMEVALIGIPWC